MRNRLYILSFFVFLISTAVGQVHYPIRTYTTVNPPAPWSLDGFVSMPGKLNLQVVVDDISLQEHPVKLRLSIKGNGIHIYTRPDYTPEPLYLDGGLTEILTGDDLSGLFNPQSLIFEGYSKNQYRHNGRLPEGVYRIGFDVLDYHRDVVISRSFPALVMMYLIQAPRLVTPRETEEIDPAMMPAVRFSWMTQGITNPLADVFYRFRIWEIRPDGRAAEEIIRSSRPLFQTETQQRFLLYDATLPALESGREYAWEVEAVDRAGEVLFKNDGKSEVSTFRYGQKCPVPSPYITGVTFNSASLRWNYDSSVGLYHILLRKEGEKQWEELTTSSATYKIPNLSEFTRYEIKVKSICDDCESDESDVVRFRTNRNVNYSCGTGSGNFDLSNRNPLPELHRFDTFKAADFLVEVESVEGGNGRFSGEGLLMVPYLNFVKFKVLFGDISINTDYQMIDGDVTFVFNEETGMVLSEDDFTKNPTQTPDYQDVDVEEALKEGTGRQVSVEGEVEDISIDGNEITVTTKDGKTQTILANADETVGISPSGGDQAYVADTSSGRVYSFPKQSSGSPGNVRSSVQSGVYGGNISFSPSKNQRYGLDDPDNGKEKPQAYFKRDKSGNLVSWKSLEAGMSDYIDMLVEGDLEADSLRYIRDSGFPVPASPVGGKKSARSLMLTGGMDGDRETLSVARSTRKTGNDSSEVLTEVGALGLATYGREDRYVKLISVHDARCPDNAGFVERELNRIYSPAIVNWHVSVGENISRKELPDLNFEDFQTGHTGMVKRYTDAMRRVYKHYKRTYGVDKNTLYLFFIDYPEADKKGFMPLTGRYGFIFNFGMDYEIMAHELAHGAFNLRHPFSPESTYQLTEGTTDNLMDYGKPQGTGLWKYQWDLIHDPERVLFAWGQGEEEGAIIDFHSITKLEKEEFPVQTGGASFFTPAGLPIHFADMSKMGEMYFTTDKVNDCFDSELKPTDCQSGENHIISDKGILIAFRYNGAFYTPIIRASDKSFPGAIKASDNFFVGYKAENYYSEEYTPENTSFDVYWYQGEWNGTIPFCFDKNAYINANAFNKEEYKGAGYFATFMERRTSYSCDDYLMTLKELDKLDFFNSTLSAQYNPWGNGGLLQSIEDREGEFRLVYSVENENGRKEHYEYDYVLEDWVSIDIATAGFSAYMDLDLIAEITNLYGHQTLDILGFIPLAGEAFDVVNGMWYLVEGDGGNATLCFASMLPIVGDAAVKSSKYAIKIIKGRKLQKLFDLTDESLLAYGRIAKTLQQGGDITCRECLELSGKLLAHKPGKAAAIEKLATRITDSDQLKTVLIKVDEMGTTQKGKFLDDVGQIDDVAKFDGGLLDAWKKMDNLGADDALRQNTGALEVLDLKAKGELDKIPDPSEYLDADYISNHLAKFDEGIGRVSTRANYNEFGTLGGPNSFILPESELRQILNETGGNVRKIEKRLGMHEGDLGDNPVFGVFERESVGEIKMPSGREGGADKDLWIPGGKTSGGTTEAVVDLSENTTFLLID